MATREHVALFPDTNTLLHYPPIGEVDWLRVCDAASVTLVICMTVIEELDEKKSHPSLSKRATDALKAIRTCKQGMQRTKLEIYKREPRREEFDGDLSFDISDCRIVHLVQKYNQDSDETYIAVYSEDTGMQIRCETHDIPVIEPNRSTRLKDPSSKQQREIHKLQNELRVERDRQPKVGLRVRAVDEPSESTQYIDCHMKRNPEFIDKDIAVNEQKLNFLRTKYGPYASVERSLLKLRPEMVDYLAKYGRWVDDENRYQEILSRAFRFQLVLENTGRGPAIDVDASLQFPKNLHLLNMDDFTNRPEPPVPPSDVPRNELRDMMSQISNDPSAQIRVPHIAWKGDPSIEITSDSSFGSSIEINVPNLKQHLPYACDEIVGVFDSQDKVKSFGVPVRITAAELPEPVEMKIHFNIEVTD